MTAPELIVYDNLLHEAKYAAHAGDTNTARVLLLKVISLLNEKTPAQTGA